MVGCSRTPKKVVLPSTPITPEETVVPSKKVASLPQSVSPQDVQARVAIIIDDAGHNLKPMQSLLALPVRFDIAILPRLKYSKEIANQLHQAGFEIMLHQPMEPKNSQIDPGPGAIYATMTAEQIENVLEENFKSIPHLVGLNNHMGSKATSNQNVMEAVLKTALTHNLFFIDSVTARSKVKEAAEVVGVSILSRDIFLDNDKDPELIKRQMQKLKKIALRDGSAIGIGHFFPVTIDAIAEVLPDYQESGVLIVPVSQLIE